MPDIVIANETFAVPRGVTILAALEYLGRAPISMRGCHGGVCGACTVRYRVNGGAPRCALACETEAVDGMELMEFPYITNALSAPRGDSISSTDAMRAYPEIYSCVSCGACGRACPKGIDVMALIQYAREGDVKKSAKLGGACAMCGMCSAVCPAHIDHAGLIVHLRRASAASLGVPAGLASRIAMIERGDYESELDRLASASKDELTAMRAGLIARREVYGVKK